MIVIISSCNWGGVDIVRVEDFKILRSRIIVKVSLRKKGVVFKNMRVVWFG